jgi:predicted nucleic acid-binding protein
VILADTSAWVEFLRGSNHPVGKSLAELLKQDADIVVTEVIVMELLAGARRDRLRDLRSRLVAFPILRLEGLADFEEAALIYRTCREGGETIRSLSDCLIAVPAVRASASVLHNDADFEVIARHTSLRSHPIS